MKHKDILFTGGSGLLGKEMVDVYRGYYYEIDSEHGPRAIVICNTNEVTTYGIRYIDVDYSKLPYTMEVISTAYIKPTRMITQKEAKKIAVKYALRKLNG